MKNKNNKIIIEILISLQVLMLIGTMLYWLPFKSVEWAEIIYNNPITDALVEFYFDGLASLISIIIAFAVIICAIKGLYSMYKEKTSTSKRIISYLIYAIISLGALVIHCITFVYVFNCKIAG